MCTPLRRKQPGTAHRVISRHTHRKFVIGKETISLEAEWASWRSPLPTTYKNHRTPSRQPQSGAAEAGDTCYVFFECSPKASTHHLLGRAQHTRLPLTIAYHPLGVAPEAPGKDSNGQPICTGAPCAGGGESALCTSTVAVRNAPNRSRGAAQLTTFSPEIAIFGRVQCAGTAT